MTIFSWKYTDAFISKQRAFCQKAMQEVPGLISKPSSMQTAKFDLHPSLCVWGVCVCVFVFCFCFFLYIPHTYSGQVVIVRTYSNFVFFPTNAKFLSITKSYQSDSDRTVIQSYNATLQSKSQANTWVQDWGHQLQKR